MLSETQEQGSSQNKEDYATALAYNEPGVTSQSFINEEYMTTDSGIGEDSSLRRRRGCHADQRGFRANSSGSEKSCLLENNASSGVFLENPEYMMLNPPQESPGNDGGSQA